MATGTGKCKRKPSFVQYSVLWTSALSKAKLFKIGARGLVKASFPMTYETGLLRGNTITLRAGKVKQSLLIDQLMSNKPMTKSKPAKFK